MIKQKPERKWEVPYGLLPDSVKRILARKVMQELTRRPWEKPGEGPEPKTGTKPPNRKTPPKV